MRLLDNITDSMGMNLSKLALRNPWTTQSMGGKMLDTNE